MKRAHPAKHEVRKSVKVGPNYPESLYNIPWGGEMDHDHGSTTDKTIKSMNGTTFVPPLGLNNGYDELWTKGK